MLLQLFPTFQTIFRHQVVQQQQTFDARRQSNCARQYTCALGRRQMGSPPKHCLLRTPPKKKTKKHHFCLRLKGMPYRTQSVGLDLWSTERGDVSASIVRDQKRMDGKKGWMAKEADVTDKFTHREIYIKHTSGLSCIPSTNCTYNERKQANAALATAPVSLAQV